MATLEKNYIREYLQNTNCYKCKSSLESAKLETISETPFVLITHAICNKCKAESVITITTNGGGVTPLVSDLSIDEFKKFIGIKSVSFDDTLELHKILKNKNIWNLLDKKEKN